ncbi:MAG: sugar phosphate isomerase/epimerase [Candidatus Hadarchaeales archaeon]
MKPALSSLLFVRKRLEEALPLVQELGYEGLEVIYEVPHFTLRWEEDRERLRKLGKELKERGLEPSVHTSFVDLNPISHLPEVFELNRRLAERGMEACRLLGGEVVVVHTGSCRVPTPEFLELSKQRALSLLRSLAEKAREVGVKLAVENGMTASSPFSRPEELKEVVEEVGAWITYDVGHANLRERAEGRKLDVRSHIRSMGKSLLHLHVHDNKGVDDDHLVPGEGEIDFSSLFFCLREMGYKGMIVAELWDPNKPVEVARKGMESLRKYLKGTRP